MYKYVIRILLLILLAFCFTGSTSAKDFSAWGNGGVLILDDKVTIISGDDFLSPTQFSYAFNVSDPIIDIDEIQQLRGRIKELEWQVKELQRLTEASDGPIMCDNFDCYDSLGRKVQMWTIGK